MAVSLGIPKDSKQRIKASIVHLLKQAEDNGHCYLPNPQLCEEVIDLLKIDLDVLIEKISGVIQELNDESIIYTQQQEIDGELISCHFKIDLYEAELNVTLRIKDILNSGFVGKSPINRGVLSRIDEWLSKYAQHTGTRLSEDQLQAVREAVTNKIFILTGGPGVGKTTTSNTIIRLLRAMSKDVTLAAPTGRAAQRMTEVSGIEAKTIHRLLEWNANENTFIKNETNTIKKDVIIIDESSMLDIRLASALFRPYLPARK